MGAGKDKGKRTRKRQTDNQEKRKQKKEGSSLTLQPIIRSAAVVMHISLASLTPGALRGGILITS